MMPTVRGVLTEHRPLADLTWLRVGGPADWLFQPADEADLCDFLAALDPKVAVFPMGVGSNLIVRDGGLHAVVIRLGRGFNTIEIQGDTVVAGAAALDAHVARKAAEAATGADGRVADVSTVGIGGVVQVEVKVVEFNRSVLRQIGINFQNQNGGFSYGIARPGGVASGDGDSGSTPLQSAFKLVFGSSKDLWSADIDLLRSR